LCVPNEHTLILQSQLTSFFFCASLCQQSGKKEIRWMDMPLSLFGLLLHPKTTHLSRIFFLPTEGKTVPNNKAKKWPGMMSQIALYPDFFK